jgi:hypothetical protein
MAINSVRSSSLSTGVKSSNLWDSDTQQGAFHPIATQTLTSSGDVYFTNIPQTFQDLFISVSGRSNQTASQGGYFLGFNGNYGGNTNYSTTTLLANSSSVSSTRQTNQSGLWGDGFIPATSSRGGVFGAMNMHILNYANTTNFKTYLMQCASDTDGSGNTSITVGTWRQTSAISTIYLTPSISFVAGSTISLYGIRAGS